ncbi:MAG TPA: CBS domain-containing protein [Nocardioidaceae bacterium]|nr:CBS domain-containing protein [Nocardioidaceae bacterium]
MSTSPTRVFAARLAGLPVFDPAGDQVGRIRDLVAVLRPGGLPPRVLGLVVEVFGRRSIFVPMTRVTHVDSGQVITTGVVNMRRFEQRPTETLVFGQMLDRKVTVKETGVLGTVYDVAMEQTRTHDWVIGRIALQEGSKRFGRRGQTHVVEWDEVDGFSAPDETQGAAHLLAALEEMRPADLANVIHDLPPKRRIEIAAALGDERLADVLEELPEEDQVEILGNLDGERAADVLEEMSPDDAADLIAELPAEIAERLLALMEPEEAEDVRRLMSYEERTAGGMMTTEPVILPPDATVAEALAHVRIAELSPSLAAMVYVARPPLEPPTGKLLGVAHIQRLLREPPSTLIGHVLDDDVEPLPPTASLEDVARHLATYNMVAAPVVDEDGRLVGAVAVDDLLDHLLPENWRDTPSRLDRASGRAGGVLHG